jgi:hypothetical protein
MGGMTDRHRFQKKRRTFHHFDRKQFVARIYDIGSKFLATYMDTQFIV